MPLEPHTPGSSHPIPSFLSFDVATQTPPLLLASRLAQYYSDRQGESPPTPTTPALETIVPNQTAQTS